MYRTAPAPRVLTNEAGSAFQCSRASTAFASGPGLRTSRSGSERGVEYNSGSLLAEDAEAVFDILLSLDAVNVLNLCALTTYIGMKMDRYKKETRVSLVKKNWKITLSLDVALRVTRTIFCYS